MRWTFACLMALPLLGPAAGSAETLRIGGSGAGLQTIQRLAEAFAAQRPGLAVEVVPSLGSSGGIRAMLAGHLDIAVSSRPLKAEERSAGASAFEYGRTPLVFVVAERHAAVPLRTEDLADLYSGRRREWRDGTRVRIVLRPATESDTALVRGMSARMDAAYAEAARRPGTHVAATDQQNADALERIPGAFGAITLAQLQAEGRRLYPLALDGVVPSVQALKDGAYPHFKAMSVVTGPQAGGAARDFLAYLGSEAAAKALAAGGHLVLSGPQAAR